MKNLDSFDFSVLRIIDANWNRSREGLRTVEDFFRFVSNDEKAALYCKQLRHQMSLWLFRQSFFQLKDLFERRDTDQDCFKDQSTPSELNRESIFSVVVSNVQRVKESLRVLEEYSKLFPSPEGSLFFQKLRFDWYDFEKKYCGSPKFLESVLQEKNR